MAVRARSPWPILTALIVLGAALRAAGLDTELWFDEIASVRSVARLHGLAAVLFADHTDNKHHLVWAWIWLIGPGRPGWAYRLPSALAGVGLLPALYAVARPLGRGAALVAVLLATFCYPLVAYSSEARGYALATLAGVAAYGMCPRPARPPSAAAAAGFAAVVVAGFASHLTFATVYAGLLAWGAVDAVRRPRWAATLAAYHGPAVVVLALAWWVDVSKLRYAGGPPTAAARVLLDLTRMTLGTPGEGAVPWAVIAAVVGLCGLGLVTIGRRQGAGVVAFYLVALFVAPVVLTVARRTPFLALRYYLVGLPFVLLLLAATAAARRWPAAVVAVAAVAVQGVLGTWQLHEMGRGAARAALAHMAAGAAGPVTFASERPGMDDMTLGYFADAGRLPLVDQSAPGSPPPQWWVLDLDDPGLRGPDVIYRHGRAYQLDALYPAEPPVLTWDLYRRLDP